MSQPNCTVVTTLQCTSWEASETRHAFAIADDSRSECWLPWCWHVVQDNDAPCNIDPAAMHGVIGNIGISLCE